MNLELGCKISKLKAELFIKLSVLGKCLPGTLVRQFLSVKGLYLFSSAKTCLIEARQRIFSMYLVSKYPLVNGGIRLHPRKGNLRQIKEGIRRFH